MSDIRSQSLWLDQYPGSLSPRPSLHGDIDVDVAIVGGGFTGLWAAIPLKDADPGLDVVVLERETVGYGASGRNGGSPTAPSRTRESGTTSRRRGS